MTTANRYRGEAALTLPDGRAFLLRLTLNVLAVLEERLDARGELPQRLLGAGFGTVRAVFHAVLTARQRDGARVLAGETSIETVGELLDDIGGLGDGQPVSVCYWELVVGAGFLDRAEAVKLKLLPAGKETGSRPPADGRDEAPAPPPGG